MNYNKVLTAAMILLSIHQIFASAAITVMDDLTCDTTSCPSNKVCIDHPDGYLCVCPPKKIGPMCQFDNHCLNVTPGFCGFGYCSPTLTGAVECVCRPGIQGEYCTDDIDECQDDPCQSNEMCYNTIGSFLCVPRRHFTQNKHQSRERLIDYNHLIATSVVMLAVLTVACCYLVFRYCLLISNTVLTATQCQNRVAPQVSERPIIVRWM